MSEPGWSWKCGFLNGFGEAFWQELFGKVRRITRLVVGPQGQAIFVKAIPCVASLDPEPQFEVASMVIGSTEPKEELISDLDRSWSGGKIIPANGARFKP